MVSTLELTLLLLLVAVIGVVVFRSLHLPPMLGYLTVGIVIGPHALNWVHESDSTQHLAEFGVVFLMFSIGLEFSLPKLRSMRDLVFGLGLSQVFLTIASTVMAGFVVNYFYPLNWQASVALGGALAMSSTAIVSKMLAERLELESQHGRRIMGILLFQDLAVVPLLILVPALHEKPESLFMALLLAGVKATGVLIVLLYVGQKVMRRWFHIVTARRSQELFMLNLLLITLGLAWLTDMAGLSLALGAFVAGMLIAETEYRHQVEEDIKPFRDVLLGLFFITIGMLLNLRVVAAHAVLVLLLLLGPVLLKFGMIALLARLFGAGPGIAIRTGLGLAQAGEFGFVLLNQAGGLQLIEPEFVQIVLASMLLSMLLAPFLIMYSERIALRFSSQEWLMQSLNLTQIASRSNINQTTGETGHVVICGFGRCGQNLARVLEQEAIPYMALDLDPDRVHEAAAAGDSVVYGDAARKESLVAAGIHRAAALVITYANVQSALKILHHVQQLAPTLPVIVRTLDDSDLARLQAAGATEVVPEIVEGSLMLASHALVLLGVPMRRVVRRVQEARDARYSLLRGYFHGADDSGEGIDSEHVRLHSVMLTPGSACIGKTLGTLGLELMGVEVNAIRRRDIRAVDPQPETVLQQNDIVVLRGVPEALALAEERLLEK
ncbi:monovalent cation:proton antiporter-2 (CPA2) family protein [Ampullimonas aquatilis]|uniref:monovalent cation:proton antiporter-2 (CPA2) family protein n=1 Tax=Ampullimonas aquatilis TaxID=1341549 RepID=UPI003C76249A